MDGDDERSYVRAMLVITVALAIVTTVVAVLVAVGPRRRAGRPGLTGTGDVVRAGLAADGVDGGGEDAWQPLGGRDEQRPRR